jgi:hypothetical protein
MTKTLNPTPTFCWKLCTATAGTPLLLLSNPVASFAVLLARNELSGIPQMNRQCTASSFGMSDLSIVIQFFRPARARRSLLKIFFNFIFVFRKSHQAKLLCLVIYVFLLARILCLDLL